MAILAPETLQNMDLGTDEEVNETPEEDSSDSDVVPDTAEKERKLKRRCLSVSRRRSLHLSATKGITRVVSSHG